MRQISFIIITLISFNILGQRDLTFQFSYDSTKIYIKYVDLKPYLEPKNAKLVDLNKLIAKNDTIVLDTYSVSSDQHLDSLSFDLRKELFKAINNKKSTIIFNGKTITSFYTNKVKEKRNGELSFRGIYYFDTVTKRHFLTETIYQKWYCIGNPSF